MRGDAEHESIVGEIMKKQLTLAGLALLLGFDPALAQDKIKLGVIVT